MAFRIRDSFYILTHAKFKSDKEVGHLACFLVRSAAPRGRKAGHVLYSYCMKSTLNVSLEDMRTRR